MWQVNTLLDGRVYLGSGWSGCIQVILKDYKPLFD